MSLSYAINGTGGTAADVSVHQLDQTKLVWQSQNNAGDGTVVNTYVFNDSDPAYPVTVTVRSQFDGRNRVRKFTITLNAWATSTESITGEVIYRSISSGVFVNIPSDISVEVADLSAMLANVFGLTFKTLTAKVRDTAIAADMLFLVGKVW